MGLPSSGPILLSDIQAEYGIPAAQVTGLAELYRGGTWIPTHGGTSKIPSSGTIKFSDFYGSSKIEPVYIIIDGGSDREYSSGGTTVNINGSNDNSLNIDYSSAGLSLVIVVIADANNTECVNFLNSEYGGLPAGLGDEITGTGTLGGTPAITIKNLPTDCICWIRNFGTVQGVTPSAGSGLSGYDVFDIQADVPVLYENIGTTQPGGGAGGTGGVGQRADAPGIGGVTETAGTVGVGGPGGVAGTGGGWRRGVQLPGSVEGRVTGSGNNLNIDNTNGALRMCLCFNTAITPRRICMEFKAGPSGAGYIPPAIANPGNSGSPGNLSQPDWPNDQNTGATGNPGNPGQAGNQGASGRNGSNRPGANGNPGNIGNAGNNSTGSINLAAGQFITTVDGPNITILEPYNIDQPAGSSRYACLRNCVNYVQVIFRWSGQFVSGNYSACGQGNLVKVVGNPGGAAPDTWPGQNGNTGTAGNPGNSVAGAPGLPGGKLFNNTTARPYFSYTEA